MLQKKILLISPDFPPPFIGGSLVWIYSLISNSNFKYDVLTSENLQDINSPNINLIKSRFIKNSNNPSKFQLFIHYLFIFFWCVFNLRKKKYDIVISNPGLVGNCVIFFLGKIFKKKVIGTVYAEELTTVIYGSSLKSKIKNTLVKNFYKFAYCFISVCDLSKIILKKYNCRQNNYILPPAGKLQTNFKIFNNPSRILSVGRLIKRKGFDNLIKTAGKLKKKIPNLRLNIIGYGPELNNLKILIKEIKAEEYISILTNINREKLNDLYSKSDLFVLGNYLLKNGDTEGCPVVFIEAMSYMLPIIGGVGGGVENAINNGDNGFLVQADNLNELYDKIYLILNNSDVINRMSLNSKKKLIADHDIEKISKKFDKILTELN